MNQGDLARKTGLPASSIAHFEAGGRKPSFENLRRLATQLNVTTDYLLGRVAEPGQAAAADPLYRHVSQISDADRDIAEEFLNVAAEMLAHTKDLQARTAALLTSIADEATER